MDWDQRYIEQDTPWDHGMAAPAIAEVQHREAFAPGTRVLVPGCGLGHDARAWADHGCVASGLDISPVALQKAEQRYGAGDALEWLLQDLFEPAWAPRGAYEVVWEHTCFCTLAPEIRNRYVDAVAALLAPGGLLCGLFFTDTGMPAGEGPPFSVSNGEVADLLEGRFVLQWEKAPERAYDSRQGRESLMCWKRL